MLSPTVLCHPVPFNNPLQSLYHAHSHHLYVTSAALVVMMILQGASHGRLNNLLKYQNAENSLVTCVDAKIMANGKPCSGLFSVEQFFESRAQSSFSTHEQLNLMLMGSILSTVNASDKGVGRHQAKRQRITVTFMHRGYHLCRNTYTFLYGVSKHCIQSIKEHVLEHGSVTRTHGNTRRLPLHALTLDTIMNVLKFITN